MLRVRAVPMSRRASVEQGKDFVKVRLTSPASDGRANKELIEVLAAHFQLKKSEIRIVRGLKSRQKIVAVGREKV